MNETYHKVAEVKKALDDLKPHISEITGRGNNGFVATFGKALDIPLRGSLGADSIFAIDERIRNFTEWFIGISHDYGEFHPSRIRGYLGFVGCSGQMLDYIHTDPVAERMTVNIATGEVNPSTRTFPHLAYTHPDSKNQLKYLDKPFSEVPESMFDTQVEEGGVVLFAMNQMHCEAPLSVGTAKIFLSADFKY